MSNPIAGNQWFTNVDNTTVSASALLNAQQSGGFAQLKVAQGTFTPTAAGTYAVTDADGNSVQLPTGALITSIVMSSDLALVGGTNVLATLGLTSGVATTSQSATVTVADVNLGASTPPVVLTGVVVAATFLSATTTGTITAGVVRFRVVYVETSPA